MSRYVVHGLSVDSRLPLTGLRQMLAVQHEADVQIVPGVVPGALPAAEMVRQHYQSAPGEVLMHAPGVGRLQILQGRRICYELTAPDRHVDLAAHILGSGFAILHQQRGNVVLHAASVCRNGRAFLICGVSGAGKSTTAAHLLDQGGEMLGDDVCFVGHAPDFLVYPGPASTKLAADAFAALEGGNGMVRTGTCPSGKGIYETATRLLDQPVPLGGIIVVELAPESQDVGARELTGSEAQLYLYFNTFRKRFITSDVAQELFSKRSKLAQTVPIWRITRPETLDTREEIAKLAGDLIARMECRSSRAGGLTVPVHGMRK